VDARSNSGPPAHVENVVLGGGLIVAAFFFVAVMGALGKAAENVPTGVIVFFQSFISLLLFLPWVLRHGTSELKTKRVALHVLRALAGLLTQALMFVAVKNMPLMSAILLSKSAPLFIPLMTSAWLKEKVNGMVWSSVIVGFLGIVLVLKPSTGALSNPYAVIAVCAAIFSALGLVTVNRLSATEPTERVLFYYFLISSLASAPFAATESHNFSSRDWMYLIGIGICMAAAQLLIVLAYHHASAGRIAPYNYSVVVFSGLFGWLGWNDRPDALTLFGILLVTLGGILSTKYGGPHSRGHFGWTGHWNHRFHPELRPVERHDVSEHS
jgi:drug/metabolite transporter (DMT)-like permease